MLQPNTHTYGEIRQILSIHSEDRDITKYPNANQFEIDLPVEYKNVTSMKLTNVYFEGTLDVFSTENQNTILTYNNAPVTIPNGNYDGLALSSTLSNLLGIYVKFDDIGNKFIFQSSNSFTLDFTKPEVYNSCNQPVYSQYANWGLGFYLGFNKEVYTSINFASDLPSPPNYVIVATHRAYLKGETSMYLEVASYNSIDELQPYSMYSTQQCNAKNGGKHYSAFAKIPLNVLLFSEAYNNYFFSEPPLERLQKLKFKIRYHDGRLVDFGIQPFSFNIEINYLRNEFKRNVTYHTQPVFSP
jgi:hypothetical protein